MPDWLTRIRETAANDDGSLRFRAAAQARAAIERSRARWGERGVPYRLRGDGPAPESEWVWLGEAIVETCTGRDDLDTTPSLLAYQIRDETPMEAAMRLDRFRVAWELPPDSPNLWLDPSGDPYVARPAEVLLERAWYAWEAELDALWRATPLPEVRGFFRRRRRALRRKRALVHEAINADRLGRFVRLVRAAYAPAAEFDDRLADLDATDRRAVREALDGQRRDLVEGTGEDGARWVSSERAAS